MPLKFHSNSLNLCAKAVESSTCSRDIFKGILKCLLICLSFTDLSAQQSFERTIGIYSGSAHSGVSGIELPDTSILAIGSISDSVQRQKVCLVWTNSRGDTTRTKIVQPAALREIASFGLRNDSGSIYVSGRMEDSTTSDAMLLKLDSSGGVVWIHRLGTTTRNERYNNLCLTNEGNVVGAGRAVEIQSNYYFMKCAALHSSGIPIWTKEWRTRLGEINSICEGADSSFYATGYLLDFGDTSGSMFLLHIGANGDSLWTKKYFGAGWATGNSILCLSDGLLIAGSTSAGSQLAGDHFLVKTNFSGDTLWTRTYGFQNLDERTKALSFSSDNCYILCGNSQAYLELIKVDTLGNQEWKHDYNSGDALGNSVIATLDSGYLAAGSAGMTTGLPLVYLVKTDETGGILLGETLPLQLTNEIKVYPNPSEGDLRFMPSELNDVTITDFSGKIVFRAKHCSESLELSSLAAGAYFLFGQTEKGDVMQGKILLTKGN